MMVEVNELLELLSEVRDDIDFENEEKLIDDDLLDSFDIVQIITLIEDKYDINVPATEVNPDNFNCIKSIAEMIVRLKG